jgi:putative transposase
MAKPYSQDLRERVVKAVAQGGLSRRQAAERFGVGASTVIRWMQRWRDTGRIEPGQMGGHRPKKIAGSNRTWLLERCHDRAFTLRGLVSELAERGLKVDYRVVWAFVHAENLTHKKDSDRERARPCRRRAATRAMAEISR